MGGRSLQMLLGDSRCGTKIFLSQDLTLATPGFERGLVAFVGPAPGHGNSQQKCEKEQEGLAGFCGGA